MALIKNTGVTPTGEEIAIPIGGIATYTVTPLLANGIWSSPIIRYNGNLSVRFALQSDVTGSYVIEYYMDNVKIPFMGNSTVYNPLMVQSFQGALEGKANGVKLIYTNGNVKQNSFYIEISLGEQVQQTHRSLGVPASATNMAGVVHSAIEGRTDGAGDYKQATVTSSGSKNGIDVNVLNPTGSLDTSTLAKDATVAKDSTLTNGSQRTIIVDGNNQIKGSQANPISVKVENFPSTQAVSGTVTVSNPTPATDVSLLAKDGTVAKASTQTDGTQKTQVTNFPTSFGVSNFPTSQAITASSLPLPSGASTEATLSQVLAKLSPGTSGAFQLVAISANTQQTIAANPNRKFIVILSPSTEIKVALGFTATATNYSYRVIKDGVLEIEDKAAALSISIFAAGAANVNVTLIS